MLLEAKDKLVMIGDSITDCGRARPVGEGLFDAIGKGYVGQVDALLTAAYPERGIRVVNVGTSGNTVLDLKARWQTDVLDQKPDWLSIMIGTNDVWRQFDTPLITESHVYPEEYAATLEELVVQTRPKLKGLVLMTPFYLEPNPNDAMRAQMDRYGAIVREIAAKHDALFVDTQAAFNRVMAHIYPATIAWDRVHPSQAGHAVLARAFLQAVGFDYTQGLS
ncbi:SGNH/GDSL hydrolase family protein [Paenibacillus lignilyticus]|uniref:SGNH/GDSL hydrolase family protein n=1 Tax=Paenibacillus lignilyticus TaxID=1172615 RepID=A0ABS5C8J0_9BACL|nr:SGNH/GDSL hydrolase family protein [Paenibacillus lignilyticus]MBP3962312.1 SGNH/GDSL hydrolase family protein [Paenibacillus lignilyticus]